jgi:enoyl-CoA hydratase/carnithine racemase
VVEGLHREGGKGSTRALILASETDNSFCAGADLKVDAKAFYCLRYLLTLLCFLLQERKEMSQEE